MSLPEGMLRAEPVSAMSVVRAITVGPVVLLTAALRAVSVPTVTSDAPEAKKVNVEVTEEKSKINTNNMDTIEKNVLLL
jgi:hypothetical protein